MPTLCIVCGIPCDKSCGWCRRVSYCSVEHMRANKSTHVQVCKKKMELAEFINHFYYVLVYVKQETEFYGYRIINGQRFWFMHHIPWSQNNKLFDAKKMFIGEGNSIVESDTTKSDMMETDQINFDTTNYYTILGVTRTASGKIVHLLF